MAVSEAYVRRKYEKYVGFWPNFEFPEWSDIEFSWASSKEAFGWVEWLPDGAIRLSLDPLSRRYSSLCKSNLFHELTHLRCGPKMGHGKAFYRAQLEALNNGAVFEGLI